MFLHIEKLKAAGNYRDNASLALGKITGSDCLRFNPVRSREKTKTNRGLFHGILQLTRS
jgi:hypothetical protein